MAAPTFNLAESNTAAQTVTVVTAINFASADVASTTPSTTNPIAAGNNSFEKWERLQVATVAPNSLSAFGVYFSATAPTDSAASSSTITTKFGVNGTFATPVASTSTVATTLCSSQTAAPGTSFTAPANTANAYSGYVTQQLQTTSGAAGGNAIFPSPWTSFQYTWS